MNDVPERPVILEHPSLTLEMMVNRQTLIHGTAISLSPDMTPDQVNAALSDAVPGLAAWFVEMMKAKP